MRTREQRIIDTVFFWISFLWRGHDLVVFERTLTNGHRMEVYWRDGQKWARMLAREGDVPREHFVVRLIGKDY